MWIPRIDDTVKPAMLQTQKANYRVYGRRNTRVALRRENGVALDKDSVARLLRNLGISGATRSKTTFTTRSDKNSPRAPARVNRQFRAAPPNELLVTDITRAHHGPGSSTPHSLPTSSHARSWGHTSSTKTADRSPTR